MAAVETKSLIPSASLIPRAAINNLPIYITVNPPKLIFPGDAGVSSVLMSIINVCPHRVAFRIRTNAPMQYLVMPSAGFLACNERVRVTNLDIRTSHRRHGFVVQAMAAKEDDKDRKKIWKRTKTEDADLVQCVRVRTLRLPKESRNEELPHLPPISRSEGLMIFKPSLDEYSDKINELNKQINDGQEEILEEKQILIQAMNEVKKLEADLDRANLQCEDLSKKIKLENDRQKALKDKIAEINDILRKLRNETK